jgi:hypothetical protein
MSAEENHSGIPTRAIHEAYLDMQRSLKAYREAKDQQHQAAIEQSHGQLQQAVLTFYEMLRPHLRNEAAVRDWWEGRLPSYNGDGKPPDPDEGKGILQVQQKREVKPLNGELDNPDNLSTLKEWHDALGLNGEVRLVGIAGHGDNVLLSLEHYQKGLRHLDEWETKYVRKTERKDGFMADKTEETVERQRIPIDRLRRAARELADVADKLGALSDFDASETRTEITGEMIQEVKEWERQNL